MRNKGPKKASPLQIGERFLLSFEDPALADAPQLGRLQDRSADGDLCIDVAPECCPPRGTPVTLTRLNNKLAEYRFSSEIIGRRRLEGRLPVLLLRAPREIENHQRRASYRVSVALKAEAEWVEQEGLVRKPGVLTNLSGGGAQLFLRRLPDSELLHLSLSPPDAFVEEWAMRQQQRLGNRASRSVFSDPFQQSCERVRTAFAHIEGRIVHSRVHSEDERGQIHALALSFRQPHEGCFRLVRFLERQALQRGVPDPALAVATAA